MVKKKTNLMSAVERAQEWRKCRNDPVYFIENYVKVPTPGGSQTMKMYEPQKKVVKSFYKNHDLIFLKSRQIGISTISQAIVAHLVTFYDNCIVGVISRDNSEATDFCRKVKNILSEYPKWMYPGYENDQLQYFVLKNKSALHAAAVNSKNPGAVFRGKSMIMLIIDEAAHIHGIDQAWTGIAPALSKAQASAKENGMPYGSLIISTPNKTEGIGKWYFQQWTASVNGESQFTPHKIHWTEIPVFKNDKDWYERQCKLLNYNKKKIAQELELRFIGSDDSLFEEHVQERLQNISIDPIKIEKHKFGGELWYLREYDIRDFFIISVDTASSAGEDFSAIQVMEFETMEQIMEYKGKLEPFLFAKIVKEVAKLIPNNIIVVENTGGFGLSVINELQFDTETSYNIFGEMRQSKSKKKEFIAGLSTTGKSRPLILDAMFSYVSENPEIVRSKRLVMELLGLTNKNEKIQADKGFNDDLALAWGFACYIRKYKSSHLNIQRVNSPEEHQTHNISSALEYISSLNDDMSPLHLTCKTDDPIELKRNVEQYIKENVGVKLKGMVDVRELWQTKPIGTITNNDFNF